MRAVKLSQVGDLEDLTVLLRNERLSRDRQVILSWGKPFAKCVADAKRREVWVTSVADLVAALLETPCRVVTRHCVDQSVAQVLLSLLRNELRNERGICIA